MKIIILLYSAKLICLQFLELIRSLVQGTETPTPQGAARKQSAAASVSHRYSVSEKNMVVTFRYSLS